jgi:hypothetical protein
MYKASFVAGDQPPQRAKKELPPSAYPAPRQCVIVEDFEDRLTGSSSQKDEFTIPNIQQSRAAQRIGYETKVFLKFPGT